MENKTKELLTSLLNKQDSAKMVLSQQHLKREDVVCKINANVDKDTSTLIVDIYFNDEILFNGSLDQLKEQLSCSPCFC